MNALWTPIDTYLNKITMYRLVLYYLLALVGIGAFLGAIGALHYSPLAILSETAFITAVSYLTNRIFARVYRVHVNVESVYITALILALIIQPPTAGSYLASLPILIFAPILAIASKFIIAIRKKHIFNPAAFAVALTSLAIGASANWWVGSAIMAPFVAAGGILLTRKLRRFDLVLSFLIVASLVTAFFGFGAGTNAFASVIKVVYESFFLFLGFVMLTEPLTTPPTWPMRIVYGSLVGFLAVPYVHFGSVYLTPELALLVGNIFSYIVSPKSRLVMRLYKRIRVARDTYEFVFKPSEKLHFKPGQYLEWTLGHNDPDTRGNRRYFTIASAPEEDEIRLGVKFYPEASTFKRRLISMRRNGVVSASSLAGEFTLPKDPRKKLVFLAGGIGITPFRSMIEHLMNRGEHRDIVLMYSNKEETDIAYRALFDAAERSVGLRTVYALTDNVPDYWQGHRGFITADIIKKEVPDYLERTFYISGPHGMVVAFEKTLRELGVKSSNIKTDFFPGFA